MIIDIVDYNSPIILYLKSDSRIAVHFHTVNTCRIALFFGELITKNCSHILRMVRCIKGIEDISDGIDVHWA